MSISLACVVQLGPFDVGLALTAQLVDATGAASGAAVPITVEVGNGFYLTVIDIPDADFVGALTVLDARGRRVAAQRICAGELVAVGGGAVPMIYRAARRRSRTLIPGMVVLP